MDTCPTDGGPLNSVPFPFILDHRPIALLLHQRKNSQFSFQKITLNPNMAKSKIHSTNNQDKACCLPLIVTKFSSASSNQRLYVWLIGDYRSKRCFKQFCQLPLHIPSIFFILCHKDQTYFNKHPNAELTTIVKQINFFSYH